MLLVCRGGWAWVPACELRSVAYLEGFDERLLVIEICCDHLDALGSEGFGGIAVRVASNTTHFVRSLLKRSSDDGPALGSGSTNDGEELGHFAFVKMKAWEAD